MRFLRLLAPVAAAVVIVSPATAQNQQCQQFPTTDNARQSCDAAVDLTRAYTPVAGLLISGGNPVLGSSGASGGLGRFSVTVRANAVRLALPDLGSVGADGTVPQDDEILAPAPLVEASLGLFKGFNNGLLALDLLGAAQLVPNEEAFDEIRVDPDAPRIGPVSLGLGFGARVGVLPEDGALPALAVSVMRRSIPSLGFGNVAAGDDMAADLDLHATNLRITAGKRFSVLSVGAGFGWSRYSGSARAQFDVDGTLPGTGVAGVVDVPLSAERTMFFLDGGLDFRFVKLMGEVGVQSGKNQNLGTTFTGFDDAGATTFYSVGLRMGF